MLPYTAKFLSNGAVIDSIGTKGENYVSIYNTLDKIFYLKTPAGLVESVDTKTEEVSSFYAAMPPNSAEIYSVVEHRGGVYGFSGYNAEPFDENSVIYITDNAQLVLETFDRSTKTILLSSSTGIRDFLINDDLSYFVIHNYKTITKFSRERNLLYTFTVSNTGFSVKDEIELLAIDYVREYSNEGLREYPIVMGKSLSGTFLGKINEQTQSVYSLTVLPFNVSYYNFGDIRKYNTKLTNYSFLRRTYKRLDTRNTLVFKTKLINIYNNRDVKIVEIPFDVSQFSSGYHHIALRIDAVKGFLCMFIDGREVGRRSIPAGQFIFQNITQESLGVGATYFYNNIPLFKQLKQNNFYFIDNCKIKQFKVYDRVLTDNEIILHTYNGIHIDDLVVSVPCDQRSGLDQVERYFTLDIPGHKSNNVNIIIKNSTITNSNLQTYIKDAVIERLKKVLPATAKVVDISFQNTDYNLTRE